MKILFLYAILVALFYDNVSGCVNNFEGKVLRAAGDWVNDDTFRILSIIQIVLVLYKI
jgi:hypothetical protein